MSIKLDHIYNEDCLDTLQRMKDGSIDCVITSPPYNMNLRISNGKYHSRQVVKEISTKYIQNSDDRGAIEFADNLLQVGNLL